jgi:hypothetical protein
MEVRWSTLAVDDLERQTATQLRGAGNGSMRLRCLRSAQMPKGILDSFASLAQPTNREFPLLSY